MCGIAALFSDTNSAPPKASEQRTIEKRLLAMQAKVGHRGPDGDGVHFCSSGYATIAHTRLSIIDLTEGGHQPMTSEDGRYTISFNGEIYNYKKLRMRLEEKGISTKSASDTEVILKLYIAEGISCLRQLRGMFAILIWDKVQQKVVLARDPFGIKPLYYCARNGELAVASEMRGIFPSKLSKMRRSASAAAHYFLTGSFVEPDTAVSDIKMIPAGAYAVWEAGDLHVKRYWRPKFKSQKMSRKDAVLLTRTAFEHTIRAHLVSDVPVGIFLSGGLDSTAILAAAKGIRKGPIRTYSIAFEDPEWNEGDTASRIAEHFGARHTEWLMTKERAQELFDEYLLAIDQPTIDGFNTFCVARLARDHGEKVVLSGLGGDELFAGYPSFEQIPELQQRLAMIAWLSTLVPNQIRKLLPSRLQRAVEMLADPKSTSLIHRRFRGVFSKIETDALTQSLFASTSKERFYHSNTKNIKDAVSELEFATYMRNQLLRDSDVFSMAHGLELRVPFVDRVLFEQLATIPAEIRLQQGKQLLIDAVPEIPDWVAELPKKGFRFPFDDWFKEEIGLKDDDQIPSWVKMKPWYRPWSIKVYNKWCEQHGIK